MTMWLSFTPAPPPCGHSIWGLASGQSSQWFSPALPTRIPPPSRGYRRNGRIDSPHRPYSTSASDDDDDDDDDNDDNDDDGVHVLLADDTNIVIERIALDDVDGLERMSMLCIESFFDDPGPDDDDMAGASSSTSFFSRYDLE
jgi:hypothetical protein